MARFRRGLGLRPVQSLKHVVDLQTAVPVNVILNNVLAIAVNSPASSVPTQVNMGSQISSIYLTVECVASETSTTATPNIYLIVFKNPGNNIVFPQGNQVGASDNKRHILHQEMVMINPTDGGNPRNIFKGVIKIPPRIRRFGVEDTLYVQLFIPSTGVAVNACVQCIYKEFF